ncbi:MAG: hypothetical protein IKO72_04260 [Kiritimatiellae bacterium]|nr:hypothetical protein [Kiritimatiellia bacterium]
MNPKEPQAAFLWGTPGEVAACVPADVPCFRLVNSEGALPLAAMPFSLPADARRLHRRGRVVGRAWETDDAAFCLLAGVQPPDVSAPRGVQASAVFHEMEALLAEEGMSFAQVVRTWIYIDRVCEWYGEFNAARTAFFNARRVFETFLPASTGIGCANAAGAALVSGAIAMKPKIQGVRAEIVESPLQAPAMDYRSSFSRAAEIVTPACRQLFVSGTASIRPNSHEVAYVGDIVRQIDCTMNAVHAILASRGYDWPDATRAIVYLKEPAFLGPWREWRAAHGLAEDFAAETVCDVCRDEWLFEIELDAAKGGRII